MPRCVIAVDVNGVAIPGIFQSFGYHGYGAMLTLDRQPKCLTE